MGVRSELTVDVPHLWPSVLPEHQAAELSASQGTKVGSVKPNGETGKQKHALGENDEN